ncbi:MAG: PEP-CTERM sorting domain-containing protein [Candidatus Omnitrophica bacterium]|nr:PEP-CTERM sorting domain-containing protein [Candidatus Omnitrophota bacterium]
MKKMMWFIFLLSLIVMAKTEPAQAVTIIDTITFANSTFATDSQSGTGIDYTYHHLLSDLDTTRATIASATLSLTHLGNLDDGPVREVWMALTSDGQAIGKLSESSSKEKEDEWQLSQDILKEITKSDPWSLEIGLSEQTSFNGEKLELHKSELRIHYDKSALPTTPEPATLFLLGIGLIAPSILFKKVTVAKKLTVTFKGNER